MAMSGQMRRLGRRGVFFTLMALLLIMFLFMYQRIGESAYTPTRADTEAAMVRTSIMNNYLATFEQHASDSLRTAGYFTLQNLSARIRKDGAYLTNMNASIRFCLNNQTDPYTCIYLNQSVNHSLTKLADMARSNLSIETSFKVDDVWITEEKPFEVVLWMNITYNITDSFARWERKQTVRTDVDVTGIEDPLYAREYGAGTLQSTRTFKESTVKSLQFDNTSFQQHYTNGWYIYHASGRSVIQRYTGRLDLNSTCCGLESVVRSSQISAAVIGDPRNANWSFVDYQYFQRGLAQYNYDCRTPAIARLRSPDFQDQYMRLESDHLFNYYKVNGSAEYTCSWP